MKKKGTEIVAPLVRQLPQVGEDDVDNLLTSLRAVILEARRQVLTAVDVIQVRTGWTVGRHIVEFEQGGQSRAAYGKAVLARVSARLTTEFGKGFDERNLRHMRAFYSVFPNWNALRSELSWTHYRLLLRVDSPAAREWYMNEAAAQNWIILCAHKDHTVVRYSVLHGNEQLFASKYKLILPSEEELKAELLREQALIATQVLANSADATAPRASKPKCKTKGSKA